MSASMKGTRLAWVAGVGGAWVFVLLSTGATASPTAPALALTRVDATTGTAGTLVRAYGNFPAAHLVQQPYNLTLLIRETTTGTTFVAFSLPLGAGRGTVPELAAGLTAQTVWLALAALTSSPGSRLLQIAPGRIEVLLPTTFPPGPAEAQLFVIYRGEPILSNPLPFVVGGDAP